MIDVGMYKKEFEKITGKKIDLERLEGEFLSPKGEDYYRRNCNQDPDYCNGYCHIMPCPKTLRPVRIVRVPVELIIRSRVR